ncbi:MAG: peptidoglycan-associated lipoprotein Pal [Chitinophagaceae bacterium]|nr:peptidoglycan-associated lipoprotein Pal [Rubrivivax sp.]
MFTKTTITLYAALFAAALTGCESSTKLNEPQTRAPVESRSTGQVGGSATAGGASTGTTPQSSVATVDLPQGSSAIGAAQRMVYFDYDSFAIKDEFKPVVETHAKVLTANRAKKLVIEGHTDERGGREYNLALGQKRAESVARSLGLLGATDAQIEAVSFGKERPAMQGNDEAAWARNRRAELKDR